MSGDPWKSPSAPPEPIAWPEGITAAACLTFDIDAESPVLTKSLASAQRMTSMSHQSYGPLVGVPRILDLLDRYDVKATFFAPGYSAERYPDVIRRIVDAGHEIGHHSYFHEDTSWMDEKTEADMIDRGLEALDKVAGVRPEGYRAPMWEMNYHTPKILAERGFLYDSSLMDADYPYELAAGDAAGSSLVELPVWWGLDDWEQYAFLPDLMGSGVIESPAKVEEMWTLELDAMHRLGALFDLCLHPFLSGRPARAEVVERLLGHMLELPGLWVTTLGEVAHHVRSLDLEPRTVAAPVIPDEHWIKGAPGA